MIQLVGYLVVCLVVLIVVLEAFAWALRAMVRLQQPVRLLLGLLLYSLVAFFFALPLLGLQYIDRGGAGNSGEPFRTVALIGYLVALLLAVLLFGRRHLGNLKGLGYFQGRTHG